MKHDDQLLTDALADELSPEERDQLFAALQDNPELAAEYRCRAELVGELQAAFDHEPALELDADRRQVLRQPKSPPVTLIPVLLPVAAVVVVLVAASQIKVPLPAKPEPRSALQFELQSDPSEMEFLSKPALPRPVDDSTLDLQSSSVSAPITLSPDLVPMEPPTSQISSIDPQVDEIVLGWASTSDVLRRAQPRSVTSVQRAAQRAGRVGPLAGAASNLSFYGVPRRAGAANESYPSLPFVGWQESRNQPLSTFSISIGTASYTNLRRYLSEGRLPPPEAVRLEELINYFEYELPQPNSGELISLTLNGAIAPWHPNHRLVRVALQAAAIEPAQRPSANLVFLIDVSGSMRASSKLPLVRRALQFLATQLQPDDTLAIVTYAGSSRVVLPPTSGADRDTILQAIESLKAGGSTNGAGGLREAYRLGRQTFIADGINRVILATDGDFNVGVQTPESLADLIRKEAASGIELTALGFGTGNLKDDTLEALARHGNGRHAYIDRFQEAQRLFGKELSGSLYSAAHDVKIQLEFNPAEIERYRLLGYELRRMAAEDFVDDTKDAGEFGAGQSIVALYEVVPVARHHPSSTPALKYQSGPQPTPVRANPERSHPGEWLTAKVRYQPGPEAPSREIEAVLEARDRPITESPADFRFATAVAAFGLWLRGEEAAESLELDQIKAWAASATDSPDPASRYEFIRLIETAAAIKGER